MKKNLWALGLLLLVWLSVPVYADPVSSEMDSEWLAQVEEAVREYAENLFSIMDYRSDVTPKASDYASVNGYIVANNFEIRRISNIVFFWRIES